MNISLPIVGFKTNFSNSKSKKSANLKNTTNTFQNNFGLYPSDKKLLVSFKASNGTSFQDLIRQMQQMPFEERLRRYQQMGQHEQASYSGIYKQPVPIDLKTKLQPIAKEYTDKDFELLKSCIDLDLNSDINLFPRLNNEPCLAALKFAIMTDNSIKQGKKPYIYESTPKIFEGLDPDETMDALSNFARIADDLISYEFKIKDKVIKASYINHGAIGKVYKLEDSDGNNVAIKVYYSQKDKSKISVGPPVTQTSLMGEIPILRQMTKDGVGNVPTFYMANSGLYQLGDNGEMYEDTPWMVMEFIDRDKKPDPTKKLFQQWLYEKNMKYYDYSNNPLTRFGYLLDVGDIHEENCIDLEHYVSIGVDLLKLFRSGLSIKDILEIKTDFLEQKRLENREP